MKPTARKIHAVLDSLNFLPLSDTCELLLLYSMADKLFAKWEGECLTLTHS